MYWWIHYGVGNWTHGGNVSQAGVMSSFHRSSRGKHRHPSFALERSQDILYYSVQALNDKSNRFSFYWIVDGCGYYQNIQLYADLFDDEWKHAESWQVPFHSGLRSWIHRKSNRINNIKEPPLSPARMCKAAGSNITWSENTRPRAYSFVGYQAVRHWADLSTDGAPKSESRAA